VSSIRYRPELDGLRAIAVIPVILFHYQKDLLPGGYIGVDIFFVISGFLITSIIIDEYERGVFSFANFWLRRVKRILPALIVMVLTTLLVGISILYAPELNNLGTHGLASLLSFANVSHWLIAGDYWGHSAENSPFLHAWSLSVEEQFYLFFPLILVLALTYIPKRVALLLSALGLSSVLLFFLGTQIHPSATFYLIPTRAWELGVGALLAVLSSKGCLQFNEKNIFAIAGIFLVVMSYFTIGEENGISPWLLIPVLGTALIIVFAGDTNIVNRFLSIRPLIYIGTISYSLYLWHWPVLVLSKQLSQKQNIDIHPGFLLAAIFCIAIVSYHFVERTTRRNKKAVPYIFAALLLGVFLSYSLKVGEYEEDTSFYNKTEWDGNLYNVNPHQEWPESVIRRMHGITVAQNEHRDSKAYSSGGIRKLYGGNKPDIVVLGDSHALMWARVLDEAAEELSTSIAFYSADGTPAFFQIPPIQQRKGTIFFTAGEKYAFDNARMRFLDRWKPKVVVISSRWSEVHRNETVDLIRHIGALGSKILLIEQPPELFFGDRNAPQYLTYLGLSPAYGEKQYVRHAKSVPYSEGIHLVRQIAEANSHCFLVPTSDLFLSDGKVWVLDAHDVLYIDDDHLSYSGSLKAKSRIVAALKEHIP
jgi:peptidoglycan/LPS O-acetylase OafA/YrhL